MKRWAALLVFLFGLLFFVPAVAVAQDATPEAAATPETPVISAIINDEDDSALIKVNGDAVVAAGDVIQNAAVVNGNLTVDGTVEENVFVAKGDATINGTVNGTVTVIRGTLNLSAGSTVEDVMLIDSDLNRAEGATVTGDIDDRGWDFSFGRGLAIFSALWWVGMTIVALVAAGIFAWLGRSQLFGSVGALKNDFVKSLITAIILWILLPLGAALILFTVIGAPLALLIILVVLPILWLLGMIVIGSWLGSYIIKPTSTGRVIGAAVLGTFILALVSLIPFVAIVTFIAAILGAGAFVYRAFESARNPTIPAVPGWSVQS
jgi:hypothetical protein